MKIVWTVDKISSNGNVESYKITGIAGTRLFFGYGKEAAIEKYISDYENRMKGGK